MVQDGEVLIEVHASKIDVEYSDENNNHWSEELQVQRCMMKLTGVVYEQDGSLSGTLDDGGGVTLQKDDYTIIEGAENITKPKWPIYGSHKHLPTGLYLGLFHGYKDAEAREKGDNWGAQGPCIGPLQFCHTTYGRHLKLDFVHGNDGEELKRLCALYDLDPYMPELFVNDNDCLVFQGYEYGDWTVFFHEQGKSEY